MKKILTTLLAATLMLLGTQAFAQVSVNAGYLNSTLKTKNTSDNANGAYAGVSFNVPLAGGLAIAPGVYYSMITSKETASIGSIISGSGTFTEHAINVPVYLNYGIDLARDTKVFLFGGPTLQYGLASNVKYDANVAGISGSNTVSNYDSENFNRMNVYLGGGLGFLVGAFQITVGYDYGMMNQYKGDNAINCHRSNLKLGVGFAF
ncbi:MAG: outer membrane beta-barrel protein [Bacteroidales bacterium]|nr:outer membrane beta-barrel protein [Bacteroidales bacterium]MBR6864598.1 outer membrane beta-barrel protein [Bacteroidales bacterium]MBR6883361.1 outer membrane beta-barrel protein [Bacteroidales bacterium]